MFPYEVAELVCQSLTGADVSRLLRVCKSMRNAFNTDECWRAVFGARQKRLLGGCETLTFFRGHACACVSGYRFPAIPEGSANIMLPMLPGKDPKAFMKHFHETLLTLNHEVLPFMCNFHVWVGYTCRRWKVVEAWHRAGTVTVTPMLLTPSAPIRDEECDIACFLQEHLQETLQDVIDDQASDADGDEPDWLQQCSGGRECPKCGRMFEDDFRDL